MAIQIPFPEDANFPPERRKSRWDTIIEHLYQVLPASSVEEIYRRLNQRGLKMPSIDSVRHVIKHLRKHAEEYQWTIPHVNGTHVSEFKYFSILMQKDGTFHTNPTYKGNFKDGTASMITRIATQSKNHHMMATAASQSTHLSRLLRAELSEMADECLGLHKKAKRVLRYLANNS